MSFKPCLKPAPKPKKAKKWIRRVSPKKLKEIQENNEFYENFIKTHPTGRCYECGKLLYMPGWSFKRRGKIVCHLWSAKVCPRVAYLDKYNAELACWKPCHWGYETSKNKEQDVPRLYALGQQRIPELKLKYKPYTRRSAQGLN